MLEIEDQMLDALRMLLRFLKKPVEGLNETIRVACLKEVKDLGDRTQRHGIMPHPSQRGPLIMQHLLPKDTFPLPIAVAVERYLEMYEKAELPTHNRPIVDVIRTSSKIPLTRVRNITWEGFTFEGSTIGRFLTWAHLVSNIDLNNARLAAKMEAEGMQPLYEHDTSSLQYKLYSRWNLCDSIPSYCQSVDQAESIFMVLHPDSPALDLLVHFQFMLTNWIESHAKRRDLSLRDGVISYCTDLSAEVFGELMPPLSQILVVDYRNHSLYHFGSSHNIVQRMMRLGHPEYA